MIEEKFKLILQENNITFDDSVLTNLVKYCKLLQEYNQKFNLTAIVSTEDIYLKHFLDSIIITKYFNLNNSSDLVDVGTGAGFPGIVLKIFNPNLKLFLVESNSKKCQFLKVVCEELNLKNVDIINDRVENFALKKLDSFSLVISRAVADLRMLSELCLPLLKVGGTFIAMKGKLSEEVKLSEKNIKSLNGEIKSVVEYKLPFLEHERTLVVVEKKAKTPNGYPRSYDKIIKSIEKA